MTQVTYIAMTPEQQQELVDNAVAKGIEIYKNLEAKADVRGVKEWAEYLGIDKRTLVTRIEKGDIKPSFKNPYRISRYEIELAGQP